MTAYAIARLAVAAISRSRHTAPPRRQLRRRLRCAIVSLLQRRDGMTLLIRHYADAAFDIDYFAIIISY